jgi:hypothetical protein
MFRAIALTLRARLRRYGGLRHLFLTAASAKPQIHSSLRVDLDNTLNVGTE